MTPNGFVKRHYDFVVQVGTLAAGQQLLVTGTLPNKAPFVLKARAARKQYVPAFLGSGVGQSLLDNLAWKFAGPDENYYQQDMIPFGLQASNWGQTPNGLWLQTPVVYPPGAVITTRAVVGPSIVGITAQILTAGVWSAVDLDTNLPGGQTSNGGSAAVYDPLTDLIHVFGIATVGGVSDAFYQALDLANALGTFQAFTNVDFQVKAWGFGNPIIVNDTIYFGVVDPSGAFPSVLVGLPSTAPVFAAVTLNIDPTGPGITQGGFQPFGGRVSLAYDATSGVMYCVYTPDGVGLRFLWNATGTWNSQWIGHQIPAVSQVDGTQYGGLTFGSGVDYVVIGVANGHVYVLTDLDPVNLGQPVAYLIEMITSVNVPITLRGVKRFSPAVCK